MANTRKQKTKTKQTRNALEDRKIRRPRASNVQKFATAIWVWAICLAAGKTPEEIEYRCWSAIREKRDQHLPPERRAQMVFKPTRCFRHWIDWEHAKKTVNTSNDDMLHIAEELYPGTSRWLNSHLWWAIETVPVTAPQIDAVLSQLDKRVVDVLFDPEDSRQPDRPRKRKPFTKKIALQLLKIGSFDAFVASYLFVRLAYAISSMELSKIALDAHFAFYPQIARLPQIAPYYRVLFRMLSTHLISWEFPTIDRRVERGHFWGSHPPEAFSAYCGIPTKEELADINRKYSELIDRPTHIRPRQESHKTPRGGRTKDPRRDPTAYHFGTPSSSRPVLQENRSHTATTTRERTHGDKG